MLDLLDAAFDEALLLARGVVLGVLAQVAVRARLGDRLDDARALLGLEPAAAQSGASRRPFESMAYASYTNFLMKILQTIDLDLLQVIDRLAGREAPPASVV